MRLTGRKAPIGVISAGGRWPRRPVARTAAQLRHVAPGRQMRPEGLHDGPRSHTYASFTAGAFREPMENVVLIVHLILALCLIGVVLLQRSEGGGLGLGGGGGRWSDLVAGCGHGPWQGDLGLCDRFHHHLADADDHRGAEIGQRVGPGSSGHRSTSRTATRRSAFGRFPLAAHSRWRSWIERPAARRLTTDFLQCWRNIARIWENLAPISCDVVATRPRIFYRSNPVMLCIPTRETARFTAQNERFTGRHPTHGKVCFHHRRCGVFAWKGPCLGGAWGAFAGPWLFPFA